MDPQRFPKDQIRLIQNSTVDYDLRAPCRNAHRKLLSKVLHLRRVLSNAPTISFPTGLFKRTHGPGGVIDLTGAQSYSWNLELGVMEHLGLGPCFHWDMHDRGVGVLKAEEISRIGQHRTSWPWNVMGLQN